MDAAFSSITFAEPETAKGNLAALKERLAASLWLVLPTLLGQVPDPDGALNYLERYLRDAPRRVVRYLELNPTALHYLLVIFSYSRFLSESLAQQPELITWLHRRSPGEALDRIKSRETLLEELARFAATSFDEAPAVTLARFKRREYLRITLRDVLGLATVAETTLELSHLADVLLERALRICEQALENSYGTPQGSDSAGRVQTVRLTVLSLGKLGGQELNYSSDIDLMFLYGQDGQTSGGSAGVISNAEYFVRLAQAVLKLISEVTREGAVFRVDLRLRPEGQLGEMAVSLSAAREYYRSRAREWELQMLIKGRVSAGDATPGRLFLGEVQPLIYWKGFNLAAVEAVLNARQEMTRDLQRGPKRKRDYSAAWNVKLTPGGIRDIEFLSQCLQRVYGGADEWLSASGAGSTLVALQRLHDKGYLSGRDFFRLGSAYQFLRKVEHRLQLRDGLQRHTLPESRPGLARLARRCGIETAGGRAADDQLVQRIAQHFAEVREIYDRVLLPKSRHVATDAEHAEDPRVAGLAADPVLAGLRTEFPALAATVVEAQKTDDLHRRRGLHQFLSSAVLNPALIAQLEAHPGWVARAGELFARSDLAVEMLSRHPEAIAEVADCEPSGASSEGQEGEPRLPPGSPVRDSLAKLRIAHRRETLRAVVRALAGRVDPFETFATLTRLADTTLNSVLRVAFEEFAPADVRVQGKSPAADMETPPFAVIALGRLGTGEMDIGSDADLVFVVDEAADSESVARWRRLAERFVHAVSSHTREGLLFPVDTRLRPRGSEGEMVHSCTYLRDYFRSEAEGWESATYLKARALGGNRALAERTIKEVHRVLGERYGAAAGGKDRDNQVRVLARQLVHTRRRLEKESPGALAKGGFKTSSGGYYDIEYILAFLSLTRGLALGSAEGPGNVLKQVAALESAAALTMSQVETLRNAARLYRALDHALRLVTGRPSARLPEPAQASRVIHLLEEWRLPLSGGLEATVDTTRREVRSLYEHIVLASGRDVPA